MEQVDQVVRQAAENLPGVIAIAINREGVIYEGAYGKSNLATAAPVTMDTVVRIASMTKAITSVAALQLIEDGALSLDDPVEKIIPAFGDIQVLDGFDGDTPKLRPPSQPVTVHHLLTHTSGLAYNFFAPDLLKWEMVTGAPNVLSGLKKGLISPMVADPGTRWEYGINTDWLGQVVEAVSGQALDVYFDEHILSPLDMSETRFIPNGAQQQRLSAVHARGEDGSLAVMDFELPAAPEYYSGGHGLYSTARDYASFLAMILNRGTYGTEHLLRAETVDLMFQNHTGALGIPPFKSAIAALSNSCELLPGIEKRYSLGLMVNLDPVPGFRAAGSGTWAGIFNTYFWVDPTNGVAAALFTQVLPFADAKALELCLNFEQQLYQALA